MKNFILVLLCAILGCLFSGCQNNSISFSRDSQVSEFMKNMQSGPSPTVKRSSGVVIYKDEGQGKKNLPAMDFGPRDIGFGNR